MMRRSFLIPNSYLCIHYFILHTSSHKEVSSLQIPDSPHSSYWISTEAKWNFHQCTIQALLAWPHYQTCSHKQEEVYSSSQSQNIEGALKHLLFHFSQISVYRKSKQEKYLKTNFPSIYPAEVNSLNYPVFDQDIGLSNFEQTINKKKLRFREPR